MKTENKNMRIIEPGNTTENEKQKGRNTSPLRPLRLIPCPKTLYSSDRPMYASCSTSATRH